MMLMKRMLTGAALVALSTGSAAAAPAVVEAGIDLRSGPGTQFAVVTVIPPGATVDVRGCDGRWCRVSFAGVAGFADRGYLRLAGRFGAPAYGPAYAAYERPYAYDDDYAEYHAGYAPAYGYGYAGDYAYYDGGYYGPRASVGVAARERTFAERSVVRGEVQGEVRTRAGATVGVREGAREGAASRRSTEERAATISGNNPTVNAGGSAAASTREDANVRGNRAGARVRAGAGGSANANAS